jgi:hypothetical protein
LGIARESEKVNMKLFKELTPGEEAAYREWARLNYKPFDPINGVWHPVVQKECAKINEEAEIDFEKLT